MSKIKITLEDAKAELRGAATGPGSQHWSYAPAVKALLNSHDELLVMLGEMKHRAEAAEHRLQQPVKLPAAESEEEQNYLDKVIEALNSAGVQIRYNCPRCNGLLDLTYRPNGAHYCHQQVKAEIK
ncbi:hypothetical protein [Serratia fonticola]|uniref:Uncharacterized protein n=1 Tax=Serratia fonticola TaxID=47917 RepID=A0AAE7JT83_SERFO|nr:hypothetical protein [Serratia fonticola]QKJ58774.1 hypothetical protein G9399_10865 [Serratia fonticola]